MILKHKRCPVCDSKNITKNGTTDSGKQKIHCMDCNAYRVLDSSRYTEEQKEEILKTYKERSSLRGLKRIYGVDPATVTSWIKKKSI